MEYENEVYIFDGISSSFNKKDRKMVKLRKIDESIIVPVEIFINNPAFIILSDKNGLNKYHLKETELQLENHLRKPYSHDKVYHFHSHNREEMIIQKKLIEKMINSKHKSYDCYDFELKPIMVDYDTEEYTKKLKKVRTELNKILKKEGSVIVYYENFHNIWMANEHIEDNFNIFEEIFCEFIRLSKKGIYFVAFSHPQYDHYFNQMTDVMKYKFTNVKYYDISNMGYIEEMEEMEK